MSPARRRPPNVVLRGLDMHVGSQLSRLDAYRHGIERVLELLSQLRSDGAKDLQYLDIGGGLAVTYNAEEPTDLEQLRRSSYRLYGRRNFN